MKLSIATRLKPFSHQPGTKCLIPGTSFCVEVFPALIRFYDMQGTYPELIKEIPLDIQGPVNHFTVFQDLEKGCVTVTSDKRLYHILPTLTLSNKKHPEASLPSFERLSLGSHKKQEWDLVRRRGDFREIFPAWMRLGNTLILSPLKKRLGIFSLFDECEELLHSSQHEKLLFTFRKLFLAGFSGLLVPRIEDEDYQGIAFPNAKTPKISPLYLLTEGAQLIRSLFFKAESNQFFLLPHLPPEFFAGRFLNIPTEFGELSFEWTKKMVRQVYFRASCDGSISFHLRSSLQKFRVRTQAQQSGHPLAPGEEMEIKSGTLYLLDRFQK